MWTAVENSRLRSNETMNIQNQESALFIRSVHIHDSRTIGVHRFVFQLEGPIVPKTEMRTVIRLTTRFEFDVIPHRNTITFKLNSREQMAINYLVLEENYPNLCPSLPRKLVSMKLSSFSRKFARFLQVIISSCEFSRSCGSIVRFIHLIYF